MLKKATYRSLLLNSKGENNMPVPKGVDPKKFDDCVDEVKRKQGKKVNAYAVCNASLKKGSKEMKKSITEMLEKHFESKEFNEAEAKELVQKALTSQSGDVAPTTPAVETKAPETPAAAPEAAATPTPEPVKADPKLANGLFQGFTLGSTLKQGPTGNVMSNMKAPLMDYEKKYQQSTKNIQMTPKELSEIKPTAPQKKS